ncbi:MAG: hypothetical protein AB1Z98_40065, partial [Nannocystaceae bacterium]
EPRGDYLLHYFGLKLPVVVLLLFVLAAIAVGLVLARRGQRIRVSRAKRNAALVLGAAIVAPPAYAVLVRSVLYDGLRHFLFLVPLVVVVAAVMVVVLVVEATRRWPRRRVPVALSLALGGGLLVARPTADMVRLHPYEYIYFNELIGGLPGAYGNYDTDYYGSSYREGFRGLAEHLWQTERDTYLNTRYLVTGCIPELVARNYVGGNFAWVERGEDDADFYLGYTRADCHERYRRRPEALAVERMDTLLLVVRDLRAGATVYDEGDDEGGESSPEEAP